MTISSRPVAKPKKPIKSAFFQELLNIKAELVAIWEYIMPFPTKGYDQPYSISDDTIHLLIRESKVQETLKYNPFKLTEGQHKYLAIALSIMIQIVDDLIDGMKKNSPAHRSPEWKPLKNRDEMCYLRVNFQEASSKKLHCVNSDEVKLIREWKIHFEDVPFHVENHAEIIDGNPESKESKTIAVIPAGKKRAASILNNLVIPFINGYKNVAKNARGKMSKFCDKLIPTDPHSCCIDARTRNALDYALNHDLHIDTFIEMIQKAVDACPEENVDKFYHLISILMLQSWGKRYKKDDGIFRICKEDGVLCLNSISLIVKCFLAIKYGTSFSFDMVEVYSKLPQKLKSDFIKIVLMDLNFFNLYLNRNHESFSRMMKNTSDNILWSKILFDTKQYNLIKILVEKSSLRERALPLLPELWTSPYASFIMRDLHPNLRKVIWLCHQYSVNYIINNNFHYLEKVLSKMDQAQIFKFIEYTEILNRVKSNHFFELFKIFEKFLDSELFLEAIKYNVAHVFSIPKDLKVIELIIKHLSSLNIAAKHTYLFSTILDSRIRISENNKTTFLGFIIQENLPKKIAFIDAIDPLFLGISFQLAETPLPLDILEFVIDKLYDDHEKLFKVFVKCNPFSYKHALINLEKIIQLLKTKLPRKQIFELIRLSNLWQSTNDSDLGRLWRIITLYDLVNSLSIDELINYGFGSMIDKIIQKKVEEKEITRSKRIDDLVFNDHLLFQGYLGFENFNLFNSIRISVSHTINDIPKNYITNILGYYLLTNKKKNTNKVLFLIDQCKPEELLELMLDKGFNGVKIATKLFNRIVSKLYPEDIVKLIAFKTKAIKNANCAKENENYLIMVFKIFNLIAKSFISFIISDVIPIELVRSVIFLKIAYKSENHAIVSIVNKSLITLDHDFFKNKLLYFNMGYESKDWYKEGSLNSVYTEMDSYGWCKALKKGILYRSPNSNLISSLLIYRLENGVRLNFGFSSKIENDNTFKWLMRNSYASDHRPLETIYVSQIKYLNFYLNNLALIDPGFAQVTSEIYSVVKPFLNCTLVNHGWIYSQDTLHIGLTNSIIFSNYEPGNTFKIRELIVENNPLYGAKNLYVITPTNVQNTIDVSCDQFPSKMGLVKHSPYTDCHLFVIKDSCYLDNLLIFLSTIESSIYSIGPLILKFYDKDYIKNQINAFLIGLQPKSNSPIKKLSESKSATEISKNIFSFLYPKKVEVQSNRNNLSNMITMKLI